MSIRRIMTFYSYLLIVSQLFFISCRLWPNVRERFSNNLGTNLWRILQQQQQKVSKSTRRLRQAASVVVVRCTSELNDYIYETAVYSTKPDCRRGPLVELLLQWHDHVTQAPPTTAGCSIIKTHWLLWVGWRSTARRAWSTVILLVNAPKWEIKSN